MTFIASFNKGTASSVERAFGTVFGEFLFKDLMSN